MEGSRRLLPACLLLVLLALLQILVLSLSHTSDEITQVVPRLAASSRKRRLPTCLVIGVRKGGTRALVDALALHPLVRAARREVHFFNHNETFSKGVAWYREQMPLSTRHQVTIEKTPGYFTSPLAPARTRSLRSDMKLILILREPVTRTISDYTQVFYNRLEQNKSLPVFEDVAFVGRELSTEYKPLRNSLYAIHMTNWLQHFPLSQFLLLDGDRFVQDPLSQLRLAEDFLGLPHLIHPDQLVFNVSKGFFCFRKKLQDAPRCLGESKGRTHRRVKPSTLRRLHSQLRPFNTQFMLLVNRVFNW